MGSFKHITEVTDLGTLRASWMQEFCLPRVTDHDIEAWRRSRPYQPVELTERIW